MKLAVVIPCYNHAHYIANTLESVLAQTRPADRILVIDDGSSDNSVEVIRQFEDRGVECIAQENAGAHNTLNRCIQIAAETCDVISILNSDDLYEPERFERSLAAMESSGKSVLCTGLRLIDDDGAFLAEDHPRAKWFRAAWSLEGLDDLDLCEWLGVANFLATTSNVIARAEYLSANPFRDWRFNHDYFFLVGAALRDELQLLNEPLLRYRVHATNTINSKPAPLLKEMLHMQLELYATFGSQLQDDPELRARFLLYVAAAENNISSLDAGLFQLLVARMLSDQTEAGRAGLVRSLEVPELDRYPNSALVHHHNGTSPLLEGHGMATRIEELKSRTSDLRAEVTALKELNRLRSKLTRSKWLALGRIFGAGRQLGANEGKAPADKLEKLRSAVRNSKWLRLGGFSKDG